jgi:hypothetical protein
MGLGRKLPRDELAANNLELKVSLFFLEERLGLGRKLPCDELAANNLKLKVSIFILEERMELGWKLPCNELSAINPGAQVKHLFPGPEAPRAELAVSSLELKVILFFLGPKLPL